VCFVLYQGALKHTNIAQFDTHMHYEVTPDCNVDQVYNANPAIYITGEKKSKTRKKYCTIRQKYCAICPKPNWPLEKYQLIKLLHVLKPDPNFSV